MWQPNFLLWLKMAPHLLELRSSTQSFKGKAKRFPLCKIITIKTFGVQAGSQAAHRLKRRTCSTVHFALTLLLTSLVKQSSERVSERVSVRPRHIRHNTKSSTWTHKHTRTHTYVYLFVLTAAMPALPLSILGQARPGQREFPFFYVLARSEFVHIKALLLLALRLNLIKICFACVFICRKYTNTHHTHILMHKEAPRLNIAHTPHCINTN